MSAAPAPPLTEVLWLRLDAATGEVTVCDAAGAELADHVVDQAALTAGADDRTGVAVALHRAGERRAATALLAWPVPDAPGLFVAFRQAEAAAVASEVETIVNQVAHDVRNLAFAASLQAELGARRAAAAPELREHFAAVLRQVDALKRYLDRLLLYGRPIALRPVPVEIAGLLERTAAAALAAWRRDPGPPRVRVEAGPELGLARWDPGVLGLALSALLVNALRSADPAPEVTLRATAGGDGGVLIEVADRGEGIPPERLEQLQVPMRVRRPGAAGLGLALARKAVAAHRGALELSTGPAGTTVRIALPREAQVG